MALIVCFFVRPQDDLFPTGEEIQQQFALGNGPVFFSEYSKVLKNSELIHLKSTIET